MTHATRPGRSTYSLLVVSSPNAGGQGASLSPQGLCHCVDQCGIFSQHNKSVPADTRSRRSVLLKIVCMSVTSLSLSSGRNGMAFGLSLNEEEHTWKAISRGLVTQSSSPRTWMGSMTPFETTFRSKGYLNVLDDGQCCLKPIRNSVRRLI